jgi:hypothetical protein
MPDKWMRMSENKKYFNWNYDVIGSSVGSFIASGA